MKFIERPTDYIYVRLAEQAYYSNGGENLPLGWVVLKCCDQIKTDGYFGVAYQHVETRQIIISHRGTELPQGNAVTTPATDWRQKIGQMFLGLKNYAQQISSSIKDIEADIDGIIRLMVTSQQISALEFALTVQKEHSDYTLSFTGHSLGGWLAQLSTYHFMVEGHYAWCVTLDNPGSRDIIEEMHARYLDTIPASQLGTFLERLDMTTYLSSPNLINSCNKHLGSVYRLYVQFPDQTDWFNKTKNKLQYNYTSHQIIPLIEQFDPSTGCAKKLSCVTDWPHVRWPDQHEVKKIDTSGPITWMVNKLKSASPVKIPDFLTDIATKSLDAGLKKIINSIPLTRGFYKMSQVLRDYATGEVNKKEYDGFFKFATSSNQYSPEQEVDFRQGYTLNHEYHYAVKPHNSRYLHLRHMDKDLREFLWGFSTIQCNDNKEIPKNVWEDLNGYELIRGSLIEKKGWALNLTVNDTAFAWLVRVSRHLVNYPPLLKTVSQDTRTQAARLYEINIIINKIDGSIDYLTTKNEEITKRMDVLEQTHRYHGLDDSEIKKLSEQAKKHLKNRYLAKEEIEGLFGQPLKLEGQYINVQILYQSQKKDKTEKKEEEKKEDDEHVNNHEDLSAKKIALPLEKIFLPPKDILNENQKTNEQDPNESPHFILFQGLAGIGKTTMVEYVVRQWSCDKLWPEFTWVFNLRLRDLRGLQASKACEKGETWGLADWVYHMHFSGKLEMIDFKTLWQREIESQLEKSVLFILDGYDEIPDQHPCKPALEALNSPAIHKIMTSRPYGTEDLPKNRRDLEVVGFVDENVEQYVKSYFAQTPDKATKILIELRKNTDLWSNAHIPVTLNILCGVLEKSENLTATLAEINSMSGLYEAMEVALLERAYRQTENGVKLNNLSSNARAQIVKEHYASLRLHLATAAHRAFSNQKIIISQQELEDSLILCNVEIKDLSENIQQLLTLGLLKPVLGEDYKTKNEARSYEFLHFTFQEYYAAHHILWQATQNNPKNLVGDLAAIKLNPRYQLVLLFTAGALKDAKQFDAFMRALSHPAGSDMFGDYQLGLLVRCTEENWARAEQTGWTKVVTRQMQRRVYELWQCYKNYQHTYIDNRSWFWVNLLKMSSQGYRGQSEKDDLFYEVKLGIFSSSEDKERLAKFIGWFGLSTPRALEQLVSIMADKNLDIITSDVQEFKTWHAQCVAAGAVEKLNVMAATPVFLTALVRLIKDEDSNVQRTALSAVRGLGKAAATPEIIVALVDMLQSDASPTETSETIAALGIAAATPTMLGALPSMLPKRSKHIVQIVKNLGATAVEKFLESIISDLTDKNPYVRDSAVQTIGELGAVAATSEILKILPLLLVDKDIHVQCSAAKTIANLGPVAATPKILEALISCLSMQNGHQVYGPFPSDVRHHAARAIGKLGEAALTPDFLKAFIPLMKDSNAYIRCDAIKTVKELGVVSAKPEILKEIIILLTDENMDVCYHAAEAVGELSPATATPEILKILVYVASNKNTNWRIRCNFINAIGKLGVISTKPGILKVLSACLSADEDIRVRQSTVLAIEKLGTVVVTPEILEGLILLLANKKIDGYYHTKITRIIGNLSAEKAASTFLKLIEDKLLESNAFDVVGKWDATAITPKILKALISGLSKDKSIHVQCKAIAAVERLGAVVAIPSFLKALASLPEDEPKGDEAEISWSREVRDNAISALKSLVGLYLLCPIDFPQKNNTDFSLLSVLIAGSYTSGKISLSVYWSAAQNCYLWQGFVDKKPFSIKLTLEQASWIRHKTPEIIHGLNRGFWSETLLKIQNNKNLLPFDAEKDPVLFEYNQQKSGASSSNSVLTAWEQFPKNSSAYGLSKGTVVMPPNSEEKTACNIM